MAEGLKYSCGFDILLSDKSTTERIFLGIGIQSSETMDNVNLSLVIVLLSFVVGIVLLIVKKLKIKRNEQNEETFEENQNLNEI